MLSDPIKEKNNETIKTIVDTLNVKKTLKKNNDFKIQIIFPNEQASDINAAHCCYILLNLFPRFLNTVSYDGPSNIMKNFPPSHCKKISIGRIQNPTITIVLGNNEYKCENDILYVGSAGWSIYISTNKPCQWKPDFVNSLSAFYAAGLVVGEVYKYILPDDQVDKIKHFEYDLITHGSNPQPVLEPQIPDLINFDNFTLVGCGAIGQAFALALKFTTKITGKIILIDDDNVEISNIQRCVCTFNEYDNMPKVILLQRLLSDGNPTLFPAALNCKYESLKITETSFKEIVTAVDNVTTRLNVQAGLPKIVWNAWTDTSRYTLRYGVSYHVLDGLYQCLACSYYPNENIPTQLELDSKTTGISETRIKQNSIVTEEDIAQIERHTGKKRDDLRPLIGQHMNKLLRAPCGMFMRPIDSIHEPTPAPHTPFLAGVFLATQIILCKIPSFSNTSKLIKPSAEFSALHIPNKYFVRKHKKNVNCFCNDDIYRNVYDKKWN